MKKLLLIYFLLWSPFLWSQRHIKGTVFDNDNSPFAGATVFDEGSNIVSMCDFDGEFSFITTKDSGDIKITFEGYYDVKCHYTSDSAFTIVLKFNFLKFGVRDKPAITEDARTWHNSIKEKKLDEGDFDSSHQVYRFSWMPFSHKPLCVRFEKEKELYHLTYKIGERYSFYRPEGIKEEKTIILSKKEWVYFDSLINALGFDTLPNRCDVPGLDGAFWFLERKIGNYYKGFSSNYPLKELIYYGGYLLELTGENYCLPTDYSEFTKNKVFLNCKNEIITKDDIRKRLINHFNIYCKEYPMKSNVSYSFEYIVTINKKGKVTRIKQLPQDSFLDNIVCFFDNSEGRNKFKKAFRTFNLSDLHLKNKISFCFDEFYDCERGEIKE